MDGRTDSFRRLARALAMASVIQGSVGAPLARADGWNNPKAVAAHVGDEQAEEVHEPNRSPIHEAALRQPQPLVVPTTELAPTIGAFAAATSSNRMGDRDLARSTLPQARLAQATSPGAEVVGGTESRLRLSTDAGNALGKTPSVLGIGVQRRTPIVSDPRVRGGRIGRMAAAGSYWVPARIDLDTMLSKIDSRAVDDLIVIKGPYSVLYGPGFEFVDVRLRPTPRFDEAATAGSTSVDYKTNGEHLYGRQSIWGGDDDSGFRVSYGHRIGNDYDSGNGTQIPSSFNSRDWDVSLGYDLTDERHLEFRYLRLDQTNVEFPGQAFDIDFLVTDGFEVDYVQTDQRWCDQLALDAWFNRTRFEGSAQRPGKRRMLPYYDFISFVGNTDVDSTSTGFRAAATWGDASCHLTTAGADFRYIKQELNEVSSGRIGLAIWTNANSPIPDSYSGNPGAFIEHQATMSDDLRLKMGARVDSVSTNVTATPGSIAALGTDVPQSSLAAIVGSGAFDQSFSLWSAFVTATRDIGDYWQANGGFGYAERPPNLTELYAAQPFMFLLQNGLNTVTGDPTLAPERRFQFDFGLQYNDGVVRGGAHGFYAIVRDYITFENLNVVLGPPFGQVVQTQLKYVNTDIATLAGGELFGECDVTQRMTAFANVSYVEGRDQSRNGSFATRRAAPGVPSARVAALSRGFFSGIGGSSNEPLPGITPLEGRAGLRWHALDDSRPWFVELTARMVDQQNRVATSLLESTTPGFTIWDLRTSYQPTDAITLLAGLENFGDRNFREHLDFRAADGIQAFQPGISFYFGAEVVY